MKLRHIGLAVCLFLSSIEQTSAMCGSLLSYPSKAERTKWARTLVSHNQNIYEVPDFYSFFADADRESIEALFLRWYGKNSWGTFGKILGFLGDKFLALALDPGLINHSDELVVFGREYKAKHPNCTPFELRNAFSKKLGQRKVYRGMVLTENEARLVEKHGISSLGMRNAKNAVTALQETFDPYISTPKLHPRSPIDEIVSRHTDLGYEHSQWISVSQYPEVAASVGHQDSGHNNDPTRHLYLYEIELPIISVIEQRGTLSRSLIQQEKFNLVIGDSFSIPMDDPGVEMFVAYNIPASAIKSVRRYESPPPGYSRVLK